MGKAKKTKPATANSKEDKTMGKAKNGGVGKKDAAKMRQLKMQRLKAKRELEKAQKADSDAETIQSLKDAHNASIETLNSYCHSAGIDMVEDEDMMDIDGEEYEIKLEEEDDEVKNDKKEEKEEQHEKEKLAEKRKRNDKDGYRSSPEPAYQSPSQTGANPKGSKDKQNPSKKSDTARSSEEHKKSEYDYDEEPAFLSRNGPGQDQKDLMQGRLVAYQKLYGGRYYFIVLLGGKSHGQYRYLAASRTAPAVQSWLASQVELNRHGAESELYDAGSPSRRRADNPANFTHYKGIAGIAHFPDAEMMAKLDKGERQPQTLVKVVWDNSHSTWETRTGFRKLMGSRDKADAEIYEAWDHFSDIWGEYTSKDGWREDAKRRRGRSKTPAYNGANDGEEEDMA